MLKQILLVLLVGSVGLAAPQSAAVLVGFPSLLDETDVRFDLLGSAKGSAWIIDTQTLLSAGNKYTLWSLEGKLGQVGKGSARTPQMGCPKRFSAEIQPAFHRAGWVVASNAPWNLQPRPVAAVPPDNPAHLEAIRKQLEVGGLAQPSVNLLSVTRADLDGDKLDEIILVAANSIRNSGLFPVPHGDQGTYGLILVRKLIGGKVKTFVLGADVFTAQDDQRLPVFFDLVGVLDLNGDGRLEVVVFQANANGYKIIAYEWNDNRFVPRLSMGCGL